MPDPTAITIGNFDGVHRGHLALIESARREVGRHGRVVALVFDPHPFSVLKPQNAPARLTDFQTREHLLRGAGAHDVHAITPTLEFLAMSAEQFLMWLQDRYQPNVVVEGTDFRFGSGRTGSVALLLEVGPSYGFRTVVVDSVTVELMNQQMVKAGSTRVRWLLGLGRVEDAQRVLGRPYELRGIVIQGDRRGRDLGVPTANLDAGDLLVPADGIYAGRALRPDGKSFPAAISIGTKPTFGDRPRACEAHLIGYDGPLDDYGWEMRLSFTHWIRDQLRFDGLEPLIDQIHRDLRMTSTLQPAGV